MKKQLFYLVFLFALITSFSACTEKQKEQISGSMEADISGGQHFSATGTSNVVGEITTGGPYGTQLTVTGVMGNRVLTVAVLNYDENNPLGSYSFSATSGKRAIGGYNNGTSTMGDDIIVSGTLQITATAAGHLTQGNFSGTTQSGVQITNGTFSTTY